MSRTSPGAPSSDGAGVTGEAERYECPLCDHAEPAETDVYSHLMVSHRKSTLSDALLDARNARE